MNSITILSYKDENGKEKLATFTCDFGPGGAKILFDKNVATLHKCEKCDWFFGGATAILENGRPLFKYTSPGSTLSFETVAENHLLYE